MHLQILEFQLRTENCLCRHSKSATLPKKIKNKKAKTAWNKTFTKLAIQNTTDWLQLWSGKRKKSPQCPFMGFLETFVYKNAILTKMHMFEVKCLPIIHCPNRNNKRVAIRVHAILSPLMKQVQECERWKILQTHRNIIYLKVHINT